MRAYAVVMLRVFTEIGGLRSDKKKTKKLTRLGTRIRIGIKIFKICSQINLLRPLGHLACYFD
jgi:hypothetical protein